MSISACGGDTALYEPLMPYGINTEILSRFTTAIIKQTTPQAFLNSALCI